MYSKLKKFYSSDEPDNSGLTIEEMETIAEEIRLFIMGYRGLTIPEYIRRVSTIPLFELGHRKIYCIKNESKLEVYFPFEVWKILKERCDKIKKVTLTEEDRQFMRDNGGKGYEWLSQKLYMDKRDVVREAKKSNIDVSKKIMVYTQSMLDFIKNNLDKGANWLSEKMAVSSDAIRNKCQRENLSLVSKKVHYYTKEEDEFIRNNAEKGSVWISQQLKASKKSVLARALKLGIKITIISKNRILKFFSSKEDAFIRKNSSKGAPWIAKKLRRSVKSIASRAIYKNIKLRNPQHHYYTEEENNFLKQNHMKGLSYLSQIMNISTEGIRAHLKKLGLNISKTPRKNSDETRKS